MRFIFAGDDKYFLAQKRKKNKQAKNGSAEREIIWSKSQSGPSPYWKKRGLEGN